MRLNEIINPLIKNTEYTITDIVTYLQDNDWFGKKPALLEIDEETAALFIKKVKAYIKADESQVEAVFSTKFPKTYAQFNKFSKEEDLDEEDRFYIFDFLLFILDYELCDHTDKDIEYLLLSAQDELLKEHGDILTDFLAWLRMKRLAKFYKDYQMEARNKFTYQNEAYSMDDYLDLLYYLLTDEYIEENAMFRKASESRKYTNAWLYLAMHFVCSIRTPDLERMFPILNSSPEETLEQIGNGTYPNNSARMVMLSVTNRLQYLELKPSKTERCNGIEYIKLDIPTSAEVLYGKLFALAEAHRQLDGGEGPIMWKVSGYKEIKNILGDEIGALFLKRDFGSRSATKSFLQSRFSLAGEILGTNDNELCARLVSHARSHKGSYASYSSTSLIYLNDMKFNGKTPEYIAFELLERGVMSFIPGMLLDIVSKGKYEKADVSKQTEIIKSLDMTPYEVESLVSTVDKAHKNAKQVVQELSQRGINVMSALERISGGVAYSKQKECECVLSAIDVKCPYKEDRLCLGCKYEIHTKATLFMLISEYNRLLGLFNCTTDPIEKNKYKCIVAEKISPAISEITECLKQYDEETYKDYMELIKENIHG